LRPQATGNLGPAILAQLLAHAFEVTVLTRQPQQPSHHQSTFPPAVQVRRVDYTSHDSLVSALRGHDAVVSALPSLVVDLQPHDPQPQRRLLDAAAAAGVPRFIPSEFGADPGGSAACAELPVFRGKLAVREALQAHAAAGGMSYTVICTGPFLDWGLARGFMDISRKTASLYDGGDVPYSATTLPTIGRAVCEVLRRPEETANRVVRVHDVVTTQGKLLEMAQRAVGKDGWTVATPSVAAMLKSSWAAFGEGKRDFPTMLGFIVAAAWGEGFGGQLDETDNELLGIPVMTEAEVQAVVNRVAKEGPVQGEGQ
jgi:uncharacterized protein YbjT (DUF2867 family)